VFKKCPICGLEINPQGIGGHMRIKHGKTILNKTKPVESAIEHWYNNSPFEPPFVLAEFILKLFNNDDKKLIQTIKEVKKRQDDD
jgi:hypothetical protein